MDIKEIRKDFPLLVNYPNLAYLDNAATTHKPNAVLDAIADFYKHNNANPLRGLYPLSQRATDAYEDARESVRAFLHARSTEEIIFTRNASESLNLIAYSYGNLLQEGDEIVITVMEHHSNLIPWQQLAKRKNLTLKWIECDETGAFTEETFRSVVGPKTRLVAMTLVSNVLGRENDVKKYAKIAHERRLFGIFRS